MVSGDLDLSRTSSTKSFSIGFFPLTWLFDRENCSLSILTLDRPKTDQGWSNLPRWVQWRDLFSVSKRSKSITGRFLKFQILLLYNVKSQYVENLAVMLLGRFETENKSRHCTQRGKLLQPWSILGRPRVNRLKLGVSGKPLWLLNGTS